MIRITDPHDHSWRWCSMMNRRGRGNFGPRGRCRGGGRGPWWMWAGQPHDFSGHKTQNKTEGAAPAAAASADDGQQNSSEQFAQAGVNFLREVGETVAAALGNLGIDVDVDVEHEGQREKVATPDKKSKETAEAEPMDQNATGDQPAAQDTVPKEVETGQQDWTLLGDAPMEQPRVVPIVIGTPPPTAPPPPAAPQPPVPSIYPMAPIASHVPTTSITHPDPHVNQSLNALLAMGFTNEGGWLTALVEQKNGDINSVLNALQPRGH